jgi:hypothetical protein
LNIDAILGTLIGGVIGFGSGIGTDIIKRWLSRPRISICEETIQAMFDYPTTKAPAYSPDPTKFIGTRIRIQNKGTTAAEDCKATLIVGEQEYRVAWLLSKQDFTIIINSHDSEYVDLCAISSNASEWSSEHIIRFTTELGYGESQNDGRSLNISEADLKISSKNAKRSIKKIWISNVPDKDGKIVYFKAPLSLDHNNKR